MQTKTSDNTDNPRVQTFVTQFRDIVVTLLCSALLNRMLCRCNLGKYRTQILVDTLRDRSRRTIFLVGIISNLHYI